MHLPLAYYGDPVLRKKGEKVTTFDEKLKQLVKDMEETMVVHDGLGLAAPQVHVSLAIFITHVPIQTGPNKWIPGKIRHFINPKILEYSKEEWLRGEGCLSIPNVYGTVSRPLRIKIEAYDMDGNLFTEELSGLDARAFMHENDHINGVLFVDRIKGKEKEQIEAELREIKKKYANKK
jgi:peptide deformylase